MSFCINCGTQLADGSKFCINCGAQQPDAQQAPISEPVVAAPAFDPFAQAPVMEQAPVVEPVPVMEPVQPAAPAFDPFAQAPVMEQAPVAEPVPVVEPVMQAQPVMPAAPVQPMMQPVDPMAAQPPAPKKKKNLPLILGLSIGGAVLAITIAIIAIVLVLTRKTEVDLSKYVKIEVEGYDGSGRIVSYSLDKQKMLKDIMKDKGKKNVDKLKRSDIPDEIYNTINTMYFDVVDTSGSGTYKNGDKIEIEIYYADYYLDDAKLKFKNESFEYEIKGLDPLTDYDIFAGVEVTFSGMNGDGSFSYKVTSDDDIYDNVYFDYDYKYDLSNGDTITIEVKTYNGDATGSYYGYKFTSTSKTYTVEGLSKYVTGLSDLSSSNLSDLKEKAEAEIQDEYSSEYDGSLSNIKYIGSYFAKNDYDYNCYMYAIYTATLTSSDGDFEPTTVYLPVQLKYLIIDGNGDLILDNIYAYMKGSFNIDGTWNYFDGYDDPYEMYEDLVESYENDYDFESSSELPDFSERPVVNEPVEDDTTDEFETEEAESEDDAA